MAPFELKEVPMHSWHWPLATHLVPKENHVGTWSRWTVDVPHPAAQISLEFRHDQSDPEVDASVTVRVKEKNENGPKSPEYVLVRQIGKPDDSVKFYDYHETGRLDIRHNHQVEPKNIEAYRRLLERTLMQIHVPDYFRGKKTVDAFLQAVGADLRKLHTSDSGVAKR